MFKAGDKVVCVNPPVWEWDAEELTKGGVYTVKSIREDFPDECFFEECAYSWNMSRFELCKPEQEVFQKGDSLRCVDNEGVTDFLNLGEVYECEKCNSYYVWVECKPCNGVGFAHNRFEKVEQLNEDIQLTQEQIWNLYVETPEHNKYSREVKPEVFVDVYDVLRAFAVTDPCLQHLAKKALCAGLRGHKDRLEDLIDIEKSIKRAIEMHKEWEQK